MSEFMPKRKSGFKNLLIAILSLALIAIIVLVIILVASPKPKTNLAFNSVNGVVESENYKKLDVNTNALIAKMKVSGVDLNAVQKIELLLEANDNFAEVVEKFYSSDILFLNKSAKDYAKNVRNIEKGTKNLEEVVEKGLSYLSTIDLTANMTSYWANIFANEYLNIIKNLMAYEYNIMAGLNGLYQTAVLESLNVNMFSKQISNLNEAWFKTVYNASNIATGEFNSERFSEALTGQRSFISYNISGFKFKTYYDSAEIQEGSEAISKTLELKYDEKGKITYNLLVLASLNPDERDKMLAANTDFDGEHITRALKYAGGVL